MMIVELAKADEADKRNAPIRITRNERRRKQREIIQKTPLDLIGEAICWWMTWLTKRRFYHRARLSSGPNQRTPLPLVDYPRTSAQLCHLLAFARAQRSETGPANPSKQSHQHDELVRGLRLIDLRETSDLRRVAALLPESEPEPVLFEDRFGLSVHPHSE